MVTTVTRVTTVTMVTMVTLVTLVIIVTTVTIVTLVTLVTLVTPIVYTLLQIGSKVWENAFTENFLAAYDEVRLHFLPYYNPLSYPHLLSKKRRVKTGVRSYKIPSYSKHPLLTPLLLPPPLLTPLF